MQIKRLKLPPATSDLDQLAQLLADTVNSGSAVSFLAPLDPGTARSWWAESLAGLSPRARVLVARNGGRITGTVQVQPAWAPNQPHRGEVTKLMVDRRARGVGVGKALMEAIEEEARAAGLTLLTLDTRAGDGAERLYRRLGWVEAGVIPDFALDPDGRHLHPTVIFYKTL